MVTTLLYIVHKIGKVLVDVSVLSKIKQMGLFNPEFYLSHYPVTTARGSDDYDEYYSELLEHYLESGWIDGFDPSEKFSTSDYICNSSFPEVFL